jgi:uncharacterized membrane protein YqaE (UPF0057 family)
LLMIRFQPSLSDSFIFLTLTRLVVVLKFINFRFALFTPPLGDFHKSPFVADVLDIDIILLVSYDGKLGTTDFSTHVLIF